MRNAVKYIKNNLWLALSFVGILNIICCAATTYKLYALYVLFK